MLKHRVTPQRRRHHSQGSETSYDYNLDGGIIGGQLHYSGEHQQQGGHHFLQQQHPTSQSLSPISTSSISPSAMPFGCFGNKWPSGILSNSAFSLDRSRGQQQHPSRRLSDDDEADDCDDGGETPKTPRKGSSHTSSAGGSPRHAVTPGAAATSASDCSVAGQPPENASSEVMRRWNSFHSTHGECHPNRFRRNRKSTSPSIDAGRLRKLSAIAHHHQHQSSTPPRHRYGRHSVQDDSQLTTPRAWQLRRGKSLAENTPAGGISPVEEMTHLMVQQQVQQHMQAKNVSNSSSFNASVSDDGSLTGQVSPNSQTSFGKRNGGSCRRPSECFVLETSEMIVIDYPEIHPQYNLPYQYKPRQPQQVSAANLCSSSVAVATTSIIAAVNTSPANQNQSSVLSPQNHINHHHQYHQHHSLLHQHYNQAALSLTTKTSPTGGAGGVAGEGLNVVGIGSCGNNTTNSGSCTPTSASGGGTHKSQGGGGSSQPPTPTSSSQQYHQQQQQHNIGGGGGGGGGGGEGGSGTAASYIQYQQHQLPSLPLPVHQIHHRSSTPGGIGCGNDLAAAIGALNLNYHQHRASAGCLTPTITTTAMDHHHLRHTMTGFSGGNRPELYQKCNRGSHSSDTSSAYSGSDTMTSVHSSSLDADEVDLSGLVESVVDSDEEDLAESMDSLNVRDAVRDCLEKDPSERTEDDIETLLDFTQTLKAFTNMTLAVRRALCSVMVFAVVDKAGTMVMSDGEELDSWSVLINGHVEIEHSNGEKEELQVGDSFGILPTMDKLYHRGVMRTKCDDCQFVCITQTDYYRIQHQGEENTKRHEENGQVVMVTELRLSGPDPGTSLRRGHVVIRATVERLLLQLIEENSMTDPTYVEDFLLTHRTFIDNSQEVAQQLLTWFENEDVSPLQTTATPTEIRDRVTRVVLLWVNNHFTDFETDPQMMGFLETFESGLEKKNMFGQLRLLHIACAAKARTRNVTLTRSSRDEDLHFTIIGGYEHGGYGIFISKVEKKTKAEDVGLKRGDQILEVNGQSFEHVKYNRAMEILMSSTHLSITVKSNLLAFKEMLQVPDHNSSRPRQNRRRICTDIAKLDPRSVVARLSTVELLNPSGLMISSDQVDHWASPIRDIGTKDLSSSTAGSLAITTNSSSSSASSSSSSHKGFMTLGPKRRIQKALIKMNLLPKNSVATLSDSGGGGSGSVGGDVENIATTPAASSSCSVTNNNSTNNNNNNLSISNSNSSSQHQQKNLAINQPVSSGAGPQTLQQQSQQSQLYHSHSNPDLTTIYYEDTRQTDYPEHVLKVYKSDQTCKYLLINKETTAHEVVMLALQEFGIHETSSNFSLCEVSVGEGGMIKQRRLPDQLQNLAERIGLCSRYYLKTNGITETLVPDDLAPELIREATVHFLQLNANEVAIQLTFQDFAIFRQIESTEYVDDLFELKSKYGTPMLKQFAELVNREMFWVVTEVCSEHNMVRRMKIVKQFIKIARHCKECRNFNSMFAIISGLGHAAVSRLRQTWEKLPTKYQKLFADLQDLMDPSRNMSKYRQLVQAELLVQHPIIPFYPVVKKDLTFIHLGNDTHVESLINFEKLRMIAKEVRLLTHMCSTTFDLLTMLEFQGHVPSSAMVSLNQMSVSAGVVGGSSTGGGSNMGLHTLHGQATVKRRKKSTAAPNPKKMFEEAQMVRRVKAYLNNMKVTTDEDALHTFSLECEPSSATGGNTTGTGGGGGTGSGGGSAPNSVMIRKRHPSPTLSTTSSTSSTSEGKKGGGSGSIGSHGGQKFGAASPQAVKKILALSEQTKTRPHQPRHAGIPLPLVGHPLHLPLHHSSVSPSPSPGAHRRMGSSSSAGSVSYSGHSFTLAGNGNHSSSQGNGANTGSGNGGRAVHERSHSDTPTPLPSVDLSVESSSVTSLSNLPLRKTITSASVTSSDSGHGSCVQADTHSNCSEGSSSGGLYHVASSIVHNSPSPTLQQRRHSAAHEFFF
ncbi:rap guanine nucleotide exchange factor 2 isoform X3 [Hermetia illucens]|uniref:rap guanine nucleotide exchange factor 2 isoform X3 n=1 Tax=Hermetia illucens TaxID=343691 RepID=UPI0018CC49C7|nr:rap guanine nucleotide exchange factor 2 isoform X3 [Hermetia illucens]